MNEDLGPCHFPIWELTKWGPMWVDTQIGGEPQEPDFEHEVWPGVMAAVLEETSETGEPETWIPLIHSTRPGLGCVSAWLDSLPTDRRYVVPSVINTKLKTMLRHRGFKHRRWWAEEWGEDADVMVREPRA